MTKRAPTASSSACAEGSSPKLQLREALAREEYVDRDVSIIEIAAYANASIGSRADLVDDAAPVDQSRIGGKDGMKGRASTLALNLASRRDEEKASRVRAHEVGCIEPALEVDFGDASKA